MSHIPSSAMPHAHANGDTIDGDQPQAPGERPTTESTVATPHEKAEVSGDAATATPLTTSATQRAQDEPPLASAAPATTTGNRQGGDADGAARSTGGPEAAAGRRQTAVDGTVAAHDGSQGEPASGRSRTGLFALVLGSLALIGGAAALLFPVLQPKPEPKSKKRKRRKAG